MSNSNMHRVKSRFNLDMDKLEVYFDGEKIAAFIYDGVMYAREEGEK